MYVLVISHYEDDIVVIASETEAEPSSSVITITVLCPIYDGNR